MHENVWKECLNLTYRGSSVEFFSTEPSWEGIFMPMTSLQSYPEKLLHCLVDNDRFLCLEGGGVMVDVLL